MLLLLLLLLLLLKGSNVARECRSTVNVRNIVAAIIVIWS